MLEMSRDGVVQPVDARLLSELLEIYFADKSLSVTETTIVNYRKQLMPFREWWSDYGPANDYVITEHSFRQLYHWLENDYRNKRGEKPAASTVHTVCARVRMFFSWMFETQRLPVDLSNWVYVPQKPTPRQRYLRLHECQKLFDACRGTLRVRDQAMLALLLGTGCRRFEAAKARKEHIEFSNDLSGQLQLGNVKYDATGRHGRGRIVVFGQMAGMLLKLQLVTNRDPTDSRILQITNGAIRMRVRTLSERTGIAVSPHDFRRTFADWWMDKNQGGDSFALLMLRMQLGHSIPSNDTTANHYLDLRNPHKLVERLHRYYASPVDAIDIPEW